jgi:signal peptidase I
MPSMVNKEDKNLKIILKPIIALWAESGQHHIIPMVGSSMLPYFKAGDQLCVMHASTNLNIGEVITFFKDDMHVAHRIIMIKSDGARTVILTKGDNSRWFDAPLSPADITGRVFAVVRHDRVMNLKTFSWKILARLIVIDTNIRTKLQKMRGVKTGRTTLRGRIRIYFNILHRISKLVHRVKRLLGPVACRFRPMRG